MGIFGFGVSMFSVLFRVVFLVIFIFIIVTVLKGLGQWNRNNQAPVLNVLATVVGKREDFRHHHHSGHSNMVTAGSTNYYVTFEVESGDRMEFLVSGREFGLLVEQDFGTLRFQGTRYLGFERA